MSIALITAALTRSASKGPARMVLTVLAYHANDDALAWPSVATIADEAGLNRTTVLRALASLEDSGEILRAGNKGRAVVVYRISIGDQSRRATGDDARPVAESDQSRRATSRGERPVPVAESDTNLNGTSTPTPTTARASLKVIEGGERNQVVPIPKPVSRKKARQGSRKPPPKPGYLDLDELPSDWERDAARHGHPNPQAAWARFCTWAAENEVKSADWRAKWRGWAQQDVINGSYNHVERPQANGSNGHHSSSARRRWGEGRAIDDDAKLDIRAGALEGMGDDADLVRQAKEHARRRMGLAD